MAASGNRALPRDGCAAAARSEARLTVDGYDTRHVRLGRRQRGRGAGRAARRSLVHYRCVQRSALWPRTASRAQPVCALGTALLARRCVWRRWQVHAAFQSRPSYSARCCSVRTLSGVLLVAFPAERPIEEHSPRDHRPEDAGQHSDLAVVQTPRRVRTGSARGARSPRAGAGRRRRRFWLTAKSWTRPVFMGIRLSYSATLRTPFAQPAALDRTLAALPGAYRKRDVVTGRGVGSA